MLTASNFQKSHTTHRAQNRGEIMRKIQHKKLVSLSKILKPFGWKVSDILELGRKFNCEEKVKKLIGKTKESTEAARDFLSKCVEKGRNYRREFSVKRLADEFRHPEPALDKRIAELSRIMKLSQDDAARIAPHLDHMRGPDISNGATAEQPWLHMQEAAGKLDIITGTGEGGITQKIKGTELHPHSVQLASAMFGVDITYLVGGAVKIAVTPPQKDGKHAPITIEIEIPKSVDQEQKIDSVIRLLRFLGDVRVKEHNIKAAKAENQGGAVNYQDSKLPKKFKK
jgi:glutamate synthase domain-containing protein 2